MTTSTNLSATLIAVMLAASAACADEPTTASAAKAERKWGPAVAGLSVWAAPAGEWRFAGQLKLDLAIRNGGTMPVSLPPAEDFFVYLLLAQGQTLHFTQKIHPAAKLATWPARLKAGEELELPAIEITSLAAYPQQPGMQLKDGYPPTASQTPAEVAGLLQPGPAKVKLVAAGPRGTESFLVLTSAPTEANVDIGDISKLSEATRQRLMHELGERFRKDAWSAKVACGDAIKAGPAAVAMLTDVLKDAQAKDFARMWAVTALTGIGSETAASIVTSALDDTSAGVRHAATYQGLKMKNAAFDAALNERAVKADDPMVTAWAILGHLSFRKQCPPELLKAGVESENWRARAAVVEVLGRVKPEPAHRPILEKLAKDENERIRASAEKLLQQIK